jgi:ABC-type sugar transport system ATPase subunit
MSERAAQALSELSITLPSLTVPVRDLSGGQRQAVAVARAVMWARTAVLMDEPTAALGARQSQIVCDLMRTVAARGLGVLVVSHDLPRVLAVADRVVILWRGNTAIDTDASNLTVPEAVAIMVGYQKAGEAA